jgi:ribonuclease VapC
VNNRPSYVLDSFAVLAFFQDEPAAHRVEEFLSRAKANEILLFMAVVNLGEVFYKTFKAFGQDRADAVLGMLTNELEIEFVDVGRELALAGAAIKGRYALSYADCVAVALALRPQATVVTGDPEFRLVEGLIEVEWLPQPDSGRR